MSHPLVMVFSCFVVAVVVHPGRASAQDASPDAFTTDRRESDQRPRPSLTPPVFGSNPVDVRAESERERLVPHYLRMRTRGHGFLAGGASMFVVGTLVLVLTFEFAPTSTHSISRGDAIGLLVGLPTIAASVPMTIVGAALFGRANRQLRRLVPVAAWRGGECVLGLRREF